MRLAMSGHQEFSSQHRAKFPWADIEVCEKITIKIIAVLAGSGYKLSMPINIDADTRVYFFIRDPEEQSDCIKVCLHVMMYFYEFMMRILTL